MTNEEIKNRILMEMNDAISDDALRKLKCAWIGIFMVLL